MKVLILLSNHLNTEYIKYVEVDDSILLVAKEQFEYLSFHQFRIIYHLSASEHFAKKNNLFYRYADTFEEALKIYGDGTEILIYNPNDIWLQEMLQKACYENNLKLTFIEDINFYFTDIEKELGKPPYKLDPLYRKWRRKFGVLMNGDKPIGGEFSYDQSNRNSPPKVLKIQSPKSFKQDKITERIVKEVSETYKDHPKSDKEFNYPVSKDQAEELLKHFVEHRLSYFGKYQDAMMDNEPFMVHSLLSASINLGLLLAKDVVSLVERAYYDKNLPIEAVEGFIRQVLGWREYIRGIYIVEMKNGYIERNYFDYDLKKTDFLYKGNTSMYCLDTSVEEAMANAYNHHIQRLMIIGNLTTLMGIHPLSLRKWFLEMYVDSFDWVVAPNVFGMASYADGGLMSTKPYVSSANYINKMSNYCRKCRFNPKEKTGSDACPVNSLYYQFLENQKKKLRANPRMKYMYTNLDRIDENVLKDMLETAKTYVEKISS
jgi:deoxyribodipyrimidine photolyase-related protein